MIINVSRSAALDIVLGPPLHANPAPNCLKTLAEAGELFATMERLISETNGEWSPDGD